MLGLDNFQVLQIENKFPGEIKLAIEKRTNSLVIIRIRSPFYLNNAPNIFNLKGIVKVLSAIYDNDTQTSTIVTEYLQNGNIFPIVKKYLDSNGALHDKMTPTIRSKIIFGVASILKRLHRNNIVHRKLINNIYLDNNLEPRIKLSSRSLLITDREKFLNESYLTVILPFQPPERINHDDDNFYPAFPNDVFQYSFFLYKMFSYNIMYMTSDGPKYLNSSSSYNYMQIISNGHRFIRPNNIPDHYWELITECWQQDLRERPTFEQIVELLKNDRFALNEFGMTTDLNDLHEYMRRIEDDSLPVEQTIQTLQRKVQTLELILPPKAKIESSNSNLRFIDEEEEREFHQNLGAIGEGGTSITYKIKDTRNNHILCKKVLKFMPNQNANRNARNAIQEFEILSRINHPCICKAIAINTAEPLQINVDGENQQITTISLFLEFIEHKLSSILANNCQNTLKAKIVVEIAHAMKFIHKNGMIHRDLKIDNIMLNSVFEVKLVDFGLIKIIENTIEGFNFVQDSMTRGVGTITYMSPEMLNEENYDNKTDIYSFGVVLFFIFVGSLPRQHLRDVMSGRPIQMPNSSPSISQFCIDLISRCLSPAPSDRPSFEEILINMRDNSFNLASNIDVSIIERRDRELEYIEN